MDVATDSWGNNRIELLRGDGKGRLRMSGSFFHVGRRLMAAPLGGFQ